MGTVTDLTKQKRNPDRINVYIDGKFAFGLAAITAASLKIGQQLTASEVAALQQDDLFEKAKQSAIRFIGYRPRSIAEVTRNLKGKGYDSQLITQVIERLQEVELLDEMAFARYWVEQRETFKPRSHIALRQELQKKGISRPLIDEVLADVDETAAARKAAVKQSRRYTGLSQAEFKTKLSAFLHRRGFQYDIIKEITTELWNTVQANTEQTPGDFE